MTDGPQIEREIGAAIQAVMGQHGEFTNCWLALVETIDAEGNRGIWTATSEGMTARDSKGLLVEALDQERAATIAAYLKEERDD